MHTYNAPLADMRFVLNELGLLGQLSAIPAYVETTPDLVEAVLDEAAKLARDVIGPTNRDGDKEGAVLENGMVKTAKGFADAYRAFVEGGWNSVPFSPDYGGQGLPWTIATALQEMWQSANMAWGLCPLLNQGAVEAITEHGSDALKSTYLPRMIEGTWTGTMNLTEPQAGSDLSLVRTKAERSGDHYLISGQKIFITFGEHDMAENIVHLVLARLPDAPEGVKGISLFVVPKFIPDAKGEPGERNDLRCVSLEHKLGIMGSPTCVMSFGDNGGAKGFLVGEENQGLAYMFTMMNVARLCVGLQGLAIIERAYQQARNYALERKQGRGADKKAGPVAIANHPDVKRMLMTMRAHTEAMRALVLETMIMMDTAKHHPESAWRAHAGRRVDLLTPVIKGWFTDSAVALTSMGVQVHGGMGYIEETGAAQHFRDSRILPIYEGTNGIQANDLIGRKILREDGESVEEYLEELDALINGLNDRGGDDFASIRKHLAGGIDVLRQAVDWILNTGEENRPAVDAGAAYFLKMFGIVAGGAMMARSAMRAADRLEADAGDTDFYRKKLITARFYAENILPEASGLLVPLTQGHNALEGIDIADF